MTHPEEGSMAFRIKQNLVLNTMQEGTVEEATPMRICDELYSKRWGLAVTRMRGLTHVLSGEKEEREMLTQEIENRIALAQAFCTIHYDSLKKKQMREQGMSESEIVLARADLSNSDMREEDPEDSVDKAIVSIAGLILVHPDEQIREDARESLRNYYDTLGGAPPYIQRLLGEDVE